MKKEQLFLMLNELRCLLSSGIHLLAALNLLAHLRILKPSRDHIYYCIHLIQQGKTLSQALHTQAPRVVTAFIECGEASGQLDKSLSHLCDWLQSLQEFQRSVKQALFYPAVVLLSSLLLLLLMLLYIVPQFDALYQQFQAPLPASTQWLLDASKKAPLWFIPIAIILISVSATIILLVRCNTEARWYLERMMLLLPIIGGALLDYQHAKFCRLLHLLLASGIPLTEGLHLLCKTSRCVTLQQAVQRARQSILQGQDFQQSLMQANYFETYLSDRIRLAEQSGKLDITLEQLANYYNARLKSRLDRFKQFLQPAVILFLGLLIGIWLLLLYYPLLQLGYAV